METQWIYTPACPRGGAGCTEPARAVLSFYVELFRVVLIANGVFLAINLCALSPAGLIFVG